MVVQLSHSSRVHWAQATLCVDLCMFKSMCQHKFPLVLWFPPTSQKHVCGLYVYVDCLCEIAPYLWMSMWMSALAPCDGLALHPGNIPTSPWACPGIHSRSSMMLTRIKWLLKMNKRPVSYTKHCTDGGLTAPLRQMLTDIDRKQLYSCISGQMMKSQTWQHLC